MTPAALQATDVLAFAGFRRRLWSRRPVVGPNPPTNVQWLHEAILLATLINHPQLYDEIAEAFGMMELSVPELDNLRQEVLKTLAANPGLDRAALQRQLRQEARAEAATGILGAKLYEHAYFARPEAPAEVAREGWRETYALYRKNELKAEIEEARQRLAADLSDRSYQVLRTLKDQEHATPEAEGGLKARRTEPGDER